MYDYSKKINHKCTDIDIYCCQRTLLPLWHFFLESVVHVKDAPLQKPTTVSNYDSHFGFKSTFKIRQHDTLAYN